jgi:hypothetical protein
MRRLFAEPEFNPSTFATLSELARDHFSNDSLLYLMFLIW